ncbi:MAG: ABC transporter permease subunit [Planctomycetota bacterium]|nr:ABC transporter permease subunit [Planctomycetota bacterium]
MSENAAVPEILRAGMVRGDRRRLLVDRAFLTLCIVSAFTSVVILLVLIGTILVQGVTYLDAQFLTGYASRFPEEAGLKAALWGSVWLCGVCGLIALPLGVAAAIFLQEYSPRTGLASRVHTFIQLNISNLAGVPSIVYGVIGLTVFVRMFGVLGNPNQYDALVRIETASGSVVQGLVAQDDAATLVLDVLEVQGAALAEGADLPKGMEISAALAGKDAAALAATGPGDEVSLVLKRDFTLPLDLNFALEPVPEGVEPSDVRVRARVAENRPGTLTLLDPLRGPVTVAGEEVRSRSTVSVRRHEFQLKNGTTVGGDTYSIDAEELTVLRREGSPLTVPLSEVASYRAARPLELGSPDSLFYLRLPLGGSVLAGALTLMLVILPVIIIASQEALRAVPDSLRQGAFAAGATRWQMVSRMVLPAAMPGIMTGAILAMSRAIGEAAPLLVVGGFLFITFTPTNVMSDFAAMPLQIYQWASRPQEEFYRVAASGILVLLVVLLTFNAAAIVIRQRFQKPLQ